MIPFIDLATQQARIRDKIEAGFGGDGDGFGRFHDAAFFAFLVDQKDLRDVDFIVYARALGFGRGCGVGSACYGLLSIGC